MKIDDINVYLCTDAGFETHRKAVAVKGREEAESERVSLKVPVVSVVLHVELVENHLGEPGNIGVQGVEARLVGKDAVTPRGKGLR